MQPKNTICLTFQRGAEEAARFYTSVFPGSHLGEIQYAPSDYPGGKQGDALVVHFSVAGIPCIALNGGNFPGFVHSVLPQKFVEEIKMPRITAMLRCKSSR